MHATQGFYYVCREYHIQSKACCKSLRTGALWPLASVLHIKLLLPIPGKAIQLGKMSLFYLHIFLCLFSRLVCHLSQPTESIWVAPQINPNPFGLT